jgi:hypothetical protein
MIQSGIAINEQQHTAMNKCMNEEIDALISFIKKSQAKDDVVLPLIQNFVVDSMEKYLAAMSASVYILDCQICGNKVANTIAVAIKGLPDKIRFGFVCLKELKDQIQINSKKYGDAYENWEFTNMRTNAKFHIDMIDIIIKCYNLK